MCAPMSRRYSRSMEELDVNMPRPVRCRICNTHSAAGVLVNPNQAGHEHSALKHSKALDRLTSNNCWKLHALWVPTLVCSVVCSASVRTLVTGWAYPVQPYGICFGGVCHRGRCAMQLGSCKKKKCCTVHAIGCTLTSAKLLTGLPLFVLDMAGIQAIKVC